MKKYISKKLATIELTDDERIILNNINPAYEWMWRCNNEELFVSVYTPNDNYDDSIEPLLPFSHLFQFIGNVSNQAYNIRGNYLINITEGECNFVYNQIEDENYLGILTILNYEISIEKILQGIRFSADNKNRRKIIVDTALKTGMNKYRFIVYDVNNNGKVLFGDSEYLTPCESIVNSANSFLKEHPRIIEYSMLSLAEKEMLLNN